MKRPATVTLLVLITVALVINTSRIPGAELSRTLQSAPCKVPPTIDGKIDPEEWKAAAVVEFDLPMLHFKSMKTTTRACQWRAMNSANGLYVALHVPDAAVNATLNPLDFDLASLAFCRGTELVAGDDRKVVATGIYADKHFQSPGKEADDKRIDGKGALRYDQSAEVYTIEWAIPLNSGDKEDIQAKPGDSLRFNLAYIDSFSFGFADTQIGTVYPGGLDSAKNWGTLQLAADVQDDGGAAFQGAKWVRDLFTGFKSLPANRLKFIESTSLGGHVREVTKVLVEYDYRDPRGKPATGKAKIFLPTNGQSVTDLQPLFYAAGYEIDDGTATSQARQGFVVICPRAIEANPLVRTPNADTALLHIARALPFIDDSKVFVTGGSAGGFMTLLVAAETFPLAGAAPGVPPVNWGYNAAFFDQREKGDSRKDPNAPKTPVFDVIVPIIQQAKQVYGNDTSDQTYFNHSPIAHLDTITCPVSIYWSTADMLVPIDQVGAQWIRPFDASKFPPGFTFDPDKLTTSKLGRVKFIDALQPDTHEVFVVPEAQIKDYVAKVPTKKVAPDLQFSASKQWSINILDEGAPEPQLGHAKYAVPWSQQKFIAHVTESKIAANQLTETKLRRLLQRYAGQEWLHTELTHLDDPASEQADVLRGLKTYTSMGTEHTETFIKLYSNLPTDQQVLPAEFVQKLKP